MVNMKKMTAYFLVDCKCNMHFCKKTEENPNGFYSTYERTVYTAVPEKDSVERISELEVPKILKLDLSSGIIPLGMHDLSNIKGVMGEVICKDSPLELIPEVQKRIDSHFAGR